jgi:hypothetical protein
MVKKNKKKWLLRLLAFQNVFLPIGTVIGLTLLSLQIYWCFDIKWFEIQYVLRLIGVSGICVLAIVDIGSVLIIWLFIDRLILHSNKIFLGGGRKIFLILWVVVLFWIGEWFFMEKPFTLRLRNVYCDKNIENTLVETAPYLSEIDFSLLKKIENKASQRDFLIMHERIRFNRPEIFSQNNIGKIIDLYSTKYDVDPIYLFYTLYLSSFYGEATSGRVPFLRNMTSETFRDFVQVHLPYWFVENPLRRYLIESRILEKCFGTFGFSLRYAFQKATYDICLETYDSNIFSDIFLVLKEYREEFPEIFSKTNSVKLNRLIRDTYEKIEGNGLILPYEQPYAVAEFTKKYYDSHREDLVLFSRALFYKVTFDFEFATKVQALVANYYLKRFEKAFGVEFWEKVPISQKIVLISMLRDVYRPNIGKLSYNLYALPEFNCTPLKFVMGEAIKEKKQLLDENKIWRPRNYRRLWAGGTYKLFVLSEVWNVIYGQPLPGLGKVNSLQDSFEIVMRNYK